MGQQLVCDTVRDLLPMYIDHMTSDISNASIEGHISECEECRKVLWQMRQPVQTETAPEIREFKKFLKKSKLSLFYRVMGAAAVIAVVTCFIVNLATERRLSWFYIVAASIFTGYFPLYLAVSSSGHRILKMLTALDGCVFFLLAVIQLVLYYQMGIGGIWFWKIGMPVTVLWSVTVWFAVLIRVKFKASILTSLAVLACLAVPGNFLTNVISGVYSGFEDYAADFMLNGFGNVAAAAVLILVDLAVHFGRKGKKNHGE